VSALVLGIVGLTVLPVLGSILAIIFGGIAKGSMRRARGSMKGSGMATAGLVLGIIGLVVPILLAAIVVPLGVAFLMPGFTAQDRLQHGVDAARIYYHERGSYAGLNAAELTRIDDTIDFRDAPGQVANAVYVDAVAPATVRLYCYSSRADRFVAAASGDSWRYNYGRHWGPFYFDSDESRGW
jgi:hypothetical protein